MPRKRRKKSLHVSFRVVAADGSAVTGREVLAALAFFMDNKREPAGYRIEAVDWSKGRQHGAPRSRQAAREAMLNNFWYILKAQGLEGLRIGRPR